MATKNIVPNDNGEGGIGVTAKRWNTGFINTLTGNVTGNLTGQVLTAAQTNINSILATDLIIGEDAETAIDFGTANEIDFKVDNANRLTLTSSVLAPATTNQIDLGTSSLEFKDAFFDGTVTADAFAGPLTGNVTGNVSGTAATVTGAAQSNITSLGTLTSLAVTGNLGIGNSSPSQKLVVEGDWNQAATNNNQVYIQGSTNSNMQLRLGYDTTGDHGYIQAILNGTGGRELHLNTSGGAVVIADSGTIGCASDTDLLTLASASLTVAGNITLNVASDSNPRITFDGAAVDDGHYIQVNRSTEAMEFHASDVTVLTLDTSSVSTFAGNIAIPNNGTIGSAGNADGIKINSSGKIGINSSSTSLVYPLEVHGGNGDAIIFKDTANSVTTWLGAFGGAAVAGALTAGDDFALYAGNAEKVRIASGGDVTVSDGDLIIGTSGHGISFAATANGGVSTPDEILDDYEEGTWDPVWVGSGGEQNVDNGYYRKVGTLCYLSCSINVNVARAGGETSAISGLPFAAATASNMINAVSFFNVSTNFTGNNIPLGTIASGSSQIIVYRTSGTNMQFHSVWNSTTTGSIELSATYITA